MYKLENSKEDVRNIYKYGTQIEWVLPCLFQYEVVFGAIQTALQKMGLPQLKADIFGAPATAWSGGRAPAIYKKLEKKQLEKVVKYVKTLHNGNPCVTFSKTDISPNEIKNSYENFLLDFFIDNDFKFIVSSDKLKDYIKDKNPKSIVASSVLKPIYKFQGDGKQNINNQEEETVFYNNLLKEYDIVIVRPEYSKTTLLKHSQFIDDISKIEVLINHLCISNCPVSAKHYDFEQTKHLNKCFNMQGSSFKCYKSNFPFIEHYKYVASHTKEEVDKLVDLGVRHLKIQGRGENIPYVTNMFNIANQIFNFDGYNSVLVFLLMLSLKEEYQKFCTDKDWKKYWKFDGCHFELEK